MVLPFLVIDLVGAIINHARGHDAAAANATSLSFRILCFVLIGGWNLLGGSLLRSFA